VTRVGRLRHRLVLEGPERTEDGAGGADVAWEPVATVWAVIETRAAGERVMGEAVTAEATHRVTIRHRTDIAPEMRFRGGARVFEIVGLLPDLDRRRWTVCLCRERGQ
jgi:SPP1 family predicted phage head-tail adaptor